MWMFSGRHGVQRVAIKYRSRSTRIYFMLFLLIILLSVLVATCCGRCVGVPCVGVGCFVVDVISAARPVSRSVLSRAARRYGFL